LNLFGNLRRILHDKPRSLRTDLVVEPESGIQNTDRRIAEVLFKRFGKSDIAPGKGV
jgi:hypothetical protein